MAENKRSILDIIADLMMGCMIEEAHLKKTGSVRYYVCDKYGWIIFDIPCVTKKQFDELQEKKLLVGKEIAPGVYHTKKILYSLDLEAFGLSRG